LANRRDELTTRAVIHHKQLTTSSNPQLVTGITPDGTAVLFYGVTPTMGRDLMRLALDGTRRVTPLLQTKLVRSRRRHRAPR
jgi:hypothetical protein